ncbi:MAG: type II secretion system protein GspD [Rikenellaceae bacterium]|jgi:type IV pilus assembly protein PilQ|nr:type II secretion system protein GspD [Rikenellaceae bacterium]
MKRIFFVSLLFSFSIAVRGQDDRLKALRSDLDLLVEVDTVFRSEVDLSVGNMPLGYLLRNVAKASRVSIVIRGGGEIPVNCNLARARIDDLLYFLCKQYNLTLDITGNIVTVYPYMPPPPEIPGPKVTFDRDSSRMSYDLRNVPLNVVVRLVADASGVNLVIPPLLAYKSISGYAKDLPVSEAILSLSEANDLEAFRVGPSRWTLEPKAAAAVPGENASPRRRELTADQLEIDSLGRITLQVRQGNTADILASLCDQLGLNYYFISPINSQTSLYLRDVGLHTLLKVLFTGTDYSYYEEEGILMFGASKEQVLASVRVVQMQNRTVNRLSEAIPPELKKGVQLQVFPDLNSLVLSGDQRLVARVEQFLKSVDKTVPLVTIEVIIVDAAKNRNNEQGISLGVGDAPTVTKGTFSPGIDLSLGASAINSLIQSFNGFGAVNLGKVNANFYANLLFLEGNGSIELQSTPKLATLNGHEAELKSGERRFYKEINESLMGSQNPIQTSSYTWKSIDADLVLKIVPLVSGNNEITLTIELEQTEFTAKEEKDAPPGTTTRSFKSEIRARNEDMILLGGIERTNSEKSASGPSFIARVPILKFLFGESKDNKEVRKLNIFIKPTVIC